MSKKRLEELQRHWRENQEKEEPTISEEDIASRFPRSRGFPSSSSRRRRPKKLLRMEDELHRRIVGQNEAIKAVCRAIRRSRAGVKNRKKPIGSFVFMGPTGVGKTELARRSPHSSSTTRTPSSGSTCRSTWRSSRPRACSAPPPGYVGYEEGRPAHGEGPAPPLLGHPARRDRESAPGHLQHSPPGPGRRTSDRLVRPQGRLQERRGDHDVEHRRAVHRQGRRRARLPEALTWRKLTRRWRPRSARSSSTRSTPSS